MAVDQTSQPLRMKIKAVFICFILVVLIDVLNKNLYLAFEDAHTSTKAYWIGQSITFLAYIVFIWYVAYNIYRTTKDKWALAFKLASLNWIAFAVNDLIDEVFGKASEVVIIEYVAFIITIALTIRQWKKHLTQKI